MTATRLVVHGGMFLLHMYINKNACFIACAAWVGIFFVHFLPGFNERLYFVNAADVWIEVDGVFILIKSDGLVYQNLDGVFISDVPFVTYRPVQAGMLITIICLILNFIWRIR
jgi:hypothetical protein